VQGTSAGADVPVSGLGKGVYLVTLFSQGKTVTQRWIMR